MQIISILRFGREPGKIRGYCGHPEIGLALLRLYQLDQGTPLSRPLSDTLSTNAEVTTYFFDQEAVARLDSRPFRRKPSRFAPCRTCRRTNRIRQQTKVVGHAVSCDVSFAAAAGTGMSKDGDDELLATLATRLWQDVVTTKLLYYRQASVLLQRTEGFTRTYDLPTRIRTPRPALPSACFFWRIASSRPDSDGQYGDVMERALYNNILSGIGVRRPLRSSMIIRWPALARRRESIGHGGLRAVLRILRSSLAHLSGYLYSQRADAIAVHHYVTSEAVADDSHAVCVQSEFPTSRKYLHRDSKVTMHR